MTAFVVSLTVSVIAIMVAVAALYGHSENLTNAAMNVFNHRAQRIFKERAYICSGVFVLALAVALMSLVVMLVTSPL